MILARACAAAFLTACTWVTGPASAQTYPDHPVTLLVAFPPGGADDAIARMIQDPMQKALGQPIVIENIGAPAERSLQPRPPVPSLTATPFCSTRTRWRRA